MRKQIMMIGLLMALFTEAAASSNSDEQMLRDWIKVIASDEFGGRKPMTPFEDKTVNYLAQQLEEIGLEPAFNGSWFQPFEMIAVTAKPQGRTIFFDDDNSDGWFFRSDHYNFVKKGVRAVVVENGLKPVDPSRPNKYPMPVWYHKPSDEYHNDWDLSGTLANTNLIFSVGLSLVFAP